MAFLGIYLIIMSSLVLIGDCADNPMMSCSPSLCKPNVVCRVVHGQPVCKCLPGAPIEPRPECTVSGECPGNLACINQVCRDPCQISNICGVNADCVVYEHKPRCTCESGFTGDPQIYCNKIECEEDNECPTPQLCVNNRCL